MTARGADVRRSAWWPVARAVAGGLGVGLLLLLAGLAAVLVVVPKATGSVPLTVLTESMEPTLPPGTLLVVRPTPPDDIAVGDVVTYQAVSGEQALVSHRVVAVARSSDGASTFTTKGDANAEADAPVSSAQVRGVVWYSVPVVGYVNQAVNGARGWLVPTVAVALIAWGAVLVTRGVTAAVRRSSGQRGHGRRRSSTESTDSTDSTGSTDRRRHVGTARRSGPGRRLHGAALPRHQRGRGTRRAAPSGRR
ncbi:signal peptidase I [Curtobacterium sp. MCBA15_009]|uniref:signal peptidase I n=1 Tax=Curtobacterium sp. MCBA15_009 TaxID=1898737 RepID=UPI001113F443|nr:signal peptidase I [Curtobacterium sp. MCBA15_009]